MTAKFTTEAEAGHAWRGMLHVRRELSEEKLLELYEAFGGTEVFKSANLGDYFQLLKGSLLDSPNFPRGKYLELLSSLPKLTKSEVKIYAHHREVFTNSEVFERLWSVSPTDTLQGIFSHLTGAQVNNPEWSNVVEVLPVVHHPNNCGYRADDPHYWCYAPRIWKGDTLVAYMESFRAEMLTEFAPGVLEAIHEKVMTLSVSVRESYADSILVADEHWSLLAADKRPVLNRLVDNPLIPEELAITIAFSHKTPSIRESLARRTNSKELLERIWDSTKSEDIRRAVVHNKVSGRYLSNPELLSRYV